MCKARFRFRSLIQFVRYFLHQCVGEDFDFGAFDSSLESSPEHGSCHEDEPALSGTESEDFNFDNEVCNCRLTLCVNSFACLKHVFYFIVQSLN